MVHAAALRHHSHAFPGGRVLESRHRAAFFFLSRLRRDRIRLRVLSSRVFLARRTPVLESVQQLWRAVSRAMGHNGALPVLAHLPDLPASLVAELLLPWPSAARR